VSSEVPAPYYTLINTTKGVSPAVVVVNSALIKFGHRTAFPWHVKVAIDCEELGANGMPTSNESLFLVQVEEDISAALNVGIDALFLARVTCRRQRELLYRAHDGALANAALSSLSSNANPLRHWAYEIHEDTSWAMATPELTLVERASNVN
jgi:hypothetical protein